MKTHPEKVDTAKALTTLSAKNAQSAWTDFVILRLREKKSPGCDMRDFGAWWDAQKLKPQPR